MLDGIPYTFDLMTTKTKEIHWDGITERRKNNAPRRRLVDLTLSPGTDRRKGEKDRRRKKE